MANKIIENVKEQSLRIFVNTQQKQKGLSTVEILTILGVSVGLLGGTFWLARDPIITWFNTRVMPFWQ